MATPNLSLVPALTTTYNVGMADTFSWVPIEGAGRPLFARATYLANASDISVSLSAGDLNVNLNDVENLVRESNTLLNALTAKNVDIDLNLSAIDVNTDEVESLIRESNTKLNTINSLLSSQLGQSGFVAIEGGETATGTFTTIQVVSACKISSLGANNSTIGPLTALELPTGLTFNGPITNIVLSYGAIIAYKL